MAQHWAIIIGINQYQSLQPLMYAQFDAIELRDFLVNEIGLPPENCTLLTDVSPIFQAAAAYPARESLEQKLKELSQTKLAPGDTLWVFFSGYGVSWEGQDYLLLIDADPTRIPQTAVSLQTLLQQLNLAPTENIMVVLDMNRTQSALPNQRLGVQTVELAKSLGIPVILSCQPDQFSQEALALRHGLFTAALLEGLRYQGRLVLHQLVDYLTERLPELCQLYARPAQDPLAAIPPEKRFLMTLPLAAVTRLPLTEAAEARVAGQPWLSPAPQPGTSFPLPSLTVAGGDLAPNRGSSPPPPSAVIPPVADPATAVVEPANGESSVPLWQKWGLVAAGILLLGVLIRDRQIFLPPSTPAPEISEPTSPMVSEGVPDTSEPSPAQPSPAPLFPTGVGAVEATAASALDRAQGAIAEQRYGEALIWLEQVPLDQRTETYLTLLDQANQGFAQSGAANQDLLNSARGMIQPVPASLFSDAIDQARQVPLGDPYYEQAQQDINRWSQVILDLAEGRATAGLFAEAISAARLVPGDRPELYELAQERIAQWEQQKTNRAILNQAQAMLIPDQANSFEAAIQHVRQIPPNYPEYAIAQDRIAQWSQDMLVIARARAAEGRLEDAIAAAQLIPPDTVAYEQAQPEIQSWQAQF